MNSEKQTLRSIITKLFSYPLPRGTGWLHVFGSLLLTLFIVQILTGILLSLNYSPSSTEAWDSVRYIQEDVPSGALIRGVHHWGATAFILFLVAHILRVVIWGAYKGSRRWTWVIGCVLLLCILAFGFTGYLLPWDLRGYFGTRVGLEIAGSTPIVGPTSKKLLQGGPELGSLTLIRFYAIHIAALPIITMFLLGCHLVLVRIFGVTPRSSVGEKLETGNSKPPESFYPHQLFRDGAAAFLLIMVLLGLGAFIGAPLEGPADPQNTSYVPRPEWYFLGLQQLLRIFQGSLEPIGTVVLPGLAFATLFALPWLDRSPSTRPRDRPYIMTLTGIALFVCVGLTLWGFVEIKAEEAALNARLKEQPKSLSIEVKAGQEMVEQGRILYAKHKCDRCHTGKGIGTGSNIPPRLDFEGSRVQRKWLEAYLKKPAPIRFESDGIRAKVKMPDFHLKDSEVSALGAFLESRVDQKLIPEISEKTAVLSKVKIATGRKLFSEYQCFGCHRIGGEGAEVGPHLDSVGARLQMSYLQALLQDPQKVVPGTAMRNSQLWPEEIEALLAYLRSLR